MAGMGFPKSARLLRRQEFLETRAKGASFADGPLAASFRFRDGPPTRPSGKKGPPALARVGLTVSSRAGGAVQRNAIKRRLREAVRRELAALPAVDLVLVAREGALRATVADFRLWLRTAAARMKREAK